MATLRNVNILPTYSHTACRLAEDCVVLGQVNACFSNPLAAKSSLEMCLGTTDAVPAWAHGVLEIAAL